MSYMILLGGRRFEEKYFIASFVSGLTEELQSFLALFEPVTVAQTVELAKKQEVTLEAISRKHKQRYKLYPNLTNNLPKKPEPSTTIHQNPKPQFLPKPITPYRKPISMAEMAFRRAKGLCYNCD